MRARLQRRNSGATLIEVLISSVVALLLMGLVVQALVASSRYFTRLLQATELESACLTTLEHIMRDVSETSIRRVVCETNNLIFPAPRDDQGSLTLSPGTSHLEWSTVLCYQFDPGSKSLVKKFDSIARVGVPPRPSRTWSRKRWSIFPERRTVIKGSGQRGRIVRVYPC